MYYACVYIYIHGLFWFTISSDTNPHATSRHQEVLRGGGLPGLQRCAAAVAGVVLHQDQLHLICISCWNYHINDMIYVQ